MKAPRETILFVPCIYSGTPVDASDYLATIDADPNSSTYAQVIHRTEIGVSGVELHHSGWNSCSSCFGKPGAPSRNRLVLPAIVSGDVFVFDTSNPRKPTLHKHVKSSDIIEKADGLQWLHSTHCLADGNIMISAMGDKDGEARGGFVLLNQDFDVVGTWQSKDSVGAPNMGYDYWYNLRSGIMVSSEWGVPKVFSKGFDPSTVKTYGHHLHFWDFNERKYIKSIDLGDEGLVPLELRMLHDPDSLHGYVGAALSSNIFHFWRDAEGEWQTEKVIDVAAVDVEGWALPSMPGLITDILISMDDKLLILSNWLHGDVRAYNIEDVHAPKLVGQIWLGGSFPAGGTVKVSSSSQQPQIPTVKGVKLRGGPQMLQMSLDARRIYVTNSLFASWDAQFYPDMVKQGSHMVMLNVDPTDKENILSLDQDFFVDFGKEPNGPALAHEIRWPGGDCTSDIWK
eukprot:CAMPEP_0201547668 /NCGR_PEP_ID=MMETSP0173_2-20130828/4156_1 /ASSEMBLY_ACC=CAM_ASM_000268 /TAXON_ID=218659 /ORGANISM="Vexillifera sp., Strain DIVA3 564/2" /LENGTH=454 /DNA_ID=CAMNT_0047956795 /DNA_START=93 /DNA_END=1457 /DNA_ORIENTATION=-